MDKFVEIFSKQNPYTELKCGNSECGKKSKVKSKDFFGVKNSYDFVCPHCGCTTTFDNVHEEVEKIKKQFKKLGIKW